MTKPAKADAPAIDLAADAEVRRVFPKATSDEVTKIQAAATQPQEIEAARRLDVTPLQLAAAAFAMWKHPKTGQRFSFTELVSGEASEAFGTFDLRPGESISAPDVLKVSTWAEDKVREEARAYLVTRGLLSGFSAESDVNAALKLAFAHHGDATSSAMVVCLRLLERSKNDFPNGATIEKEAESYRKFGVNTVKKALQQLKHEYELIEAPFGKNSGYGLTPAGVEALRTGRL